MNYSTPSLSVRLGNVNGKSYFDHYARSEYKAWTKDAGFNYPEDSCSVELGVCFCSQGDEQQDGSGMEKAKSGATEPSHI